VVVLADIPVKKGKNHLMMYYKQGLNQNDIKIKLAIFWIP
jgi:hypothetical protein